MYFFFSLFACTDPHNHKRPPRPTYTHLAKPHIPTQKQPRDERTRQPPPRGGNAQERDPRRPQSRLRHESRAGDQHAGADRSHPDAHAAHVARPPGQDLRDALGQRLAQPCVRLAGRQTDCVGLAHHQQGARHSVALVVGDDVRLRAVGQLCGVRRPGQHLLHLQSEDARGQRARLEGAARPHRLSVVLSIFG